MRKIILTAMLLVGAFCGLQHAGAGSGQEKTGAVGTTAPEGAVKVTITTGGGLYGPVKSRFKVGEEIPVTISMTNSGSKPAKYCLSTSVFQNRPELKRAGKVLPYATILPEEARTEEFIQRCEMSASRQFYELQPKDTKAVDWITLNNLSSINWYGQLPAGQYELVLQRRVECCQGPMLESNKITFEVVP